MWKDTARGKQNTEAEQKQDPADCEYSADHWPSERTTTERQSIDCPTDRPTDPPTEKLTGLLTDQKRQITPREAVIQKKLFISCLPLV